MKDKIWWERNPDKFKKYKRKKFEQKEFLTPIEAEKFLEVTGNWLTLYVLGQGFPKLPYKSDVRNRNTIRFSREDLENIEKL